MQDLQKEIERFNQDPSQIDIFAKLRRELSKAEKHKELAQLIEKYATTIDEAKKAAEHLWQAAELYQKENMLDDELRVLRRSLGLDHRHRLVLERLTELANQHNRYSEELQLLELALTNLNANKANPKAIAEKHFELGERWENYFFRLDRALDHYQAAFKNNPEHYQAIDQARHIFSLLGQWQTVAQLYEVELTTTTDKKRKVELLLKAAQVQRDKIANLEKAAQLLEDASLMHPQPEIILQELVKIYTSDRWSTPTGLKKASQIYTKLAQRLDPNCQLPEIIKHVKLALKADPDQTSAFIRLETILRQQKEYKELDLLYKDYEELVDSTKIIEILKKRADLLENKLSDYPKAIQIYKQIVSIEGPSSKALSRLEELYLKVEDFTALTNLYKERYHVLENVKKKIETLHKLAPIYRDQLDKLEQAGQIYHEILALDQNDSKALEGYKDYFKRKKDFRNLAELQRYTAVQQRDSHTPPSKVCELFEELAAISENELGDLPTALEAWQEILRLGQNQTKAKTSIHRIETEMSVLQEIAKGLKVEIAKAETPIAKTNAELTRAEKYYEMRLDPLGTIENLKELLSSDPSNERALNLILKFYQRELNDEGILWAAKQKLNGILSKEERSTLLKEYGFAAQRSGRLNDEAWAYREILDTTPNDIEAHKALEDALERAEDFQALAEQYERRFRNVKNDSDKIDALRKQAKLMERVIGLPDRAINAWERLLEIDENDSETIDILPGLYARASRFSDQIKLLEKKLSLIKEQDERNVEKQALIDLKEVIATLSETKLSDKDRATELYEELFEQTEEKEFATELSRLYSETKNFRKLVEFLEKRISQSRDPQERHDLALLTAQILESELNDPQSALRIYEWVNEEIAPGTLEAYGPLKDRLLQAGDFEKFARLAEIEFLVATKSSTNDEQLGRALEIAAIYKEQLKDDEKATVAFERVLALDPQNKTAIESLYTLYKSIGAFNRLINIAPVLLNQQVNERRIFEIADIIEKQIGDPQQAFEWLRQHQDDIEYEEALSEMRRLAQSHNLYEELYEALLTRIDHASAIESVISLVDEMIDILKNKLNDPMAAFSFLRTALPRDLSGNLLLSRIEAIAEETKLFEDLYDVYDEVIQLSPKSNHIQLYAKRATLAEKTLSDPKRALEDVIRQYRATPPGQSREEKLPEIERLAEASHRWGRALGIHFQRLERADKEKGKIILLHLAQLLEKKINSKPRAFDAWLHILFRDPTDKEAFKHAHRLAEYLDANQPETKEPLDLFHLSDDDDPVELDIDDLLIEETNTPPSPPPLIIKSTKDDRNDDRTMELDDRALIEVAQLKPPKTTKRQRARTIRFVLPKKLKEEQLPPVSIEFAKRLADTLIKIAERQGSEQRKHFLVDAALVYNTLANSPKRAMESLADAALLDFSFSKPMELLYTIAEKANLWDLYFDITDDLIHSATDAADLKVLHLKAAQIRLERSDLKDASKHLDVVFSLDPHDSQALSTLTNIYRQQGDHKELSQLLERQLKELGPTMQPADRITLRQELVDLYDRDLDSPKYAAQHLSSLIELKGIDNENLNRLADLYQKDGDYARYVETLERLLIISSEDKIFLLQKIATSYNVELDLPHQAIKAYEEILRHDSHNENALNALEKLFNQHKEFRKLCDIHYKQLENEKDQEKRLNIALKLSSSLKEINNFSKASEILLALKDEGIESPQIDKELTEAFISAEMNDDAISLIKMRAENSNEDDGKQNVALYLQLANLCQQNSDFDGQREAIQKALAIDRKNKTALLQLIEVEKTNQRPAEFANAALEIAGVVSENQAIDYLLESASILVEWNAIKEAIDLYDTILQLDDQHSLAINALLSLVEDPQRRIALLSAKIRITQDPKLRAQQLVEVGRIQLNLGSAKTHATNTLLRALEADPTSIEAIDIYTKVLIEDEKLEEATKVLTEALEKVRSTPAFRQSGPLYYRLGKISEEQGHDDDAYQFFMEGLRLSSTDLRMRIAVGEICFRKKRWREALRHLRQTLKHPQASKMTSRSANALYHAGLCEEKLRRPELAAELYHAALELDPKHKEALQELSTNALNQGYAEQAAELLERLADVTEELPRRIQMLSVVADLYIEEIQSVKRSIPALTTISDALVHPQAQGNELCFERLELPEEQITLINEHLPKTLSFLEKANQHLSAAKSAMTLALTVDSPDDIRDYFYTAAQEYLMCNEEHAAELTLRHLLKNHPTHSQSALMLARILETRGLEEDVIKLLSSHLKEVPRLVPPEERDLRADIYALLSAQYQSLGKIDDAIETMEAQVDLKEDEKVRRVLAKLYEQKPRRYTAAIENHRKLATNIYNVDSLFALASALAQENEFLSATIFRTLSLMGFSTDESEAFVALHIPEQMPSPENYKNAIDANMREYLLLPPSPLHEVILTLWEAAPFILDKEIEHYGVSKNDRVSPIEKTDVARVFSSCAKALDIKVVLYRYTGEVQNDVLLAALARPALLIPPGVERFPLGRLRFVIARALELSRPENIYAAGLRRENFSSLLQNVLAAFHPRHTQPANKLKSNADADRFRRKFPYKVSRKLSDIFRQHPNIPFNSALWRQHVYINANRIGLVLSGDLKSAIEQLQEENPTLLGLDLFPEATKASIFVEDLLTFSTTEAYVKARKTLLGIEDNIE